MEPEIILDDWQEEVLNYDGNILLCTGRQVGKTFIMSRKCAKYMIEHSGSKIIICSLTEDQAKLIIVMILAYLEKNHNSLIAKGKHKPTQNKITLKNKSQAIARPVGNTGDAVRGFTGDVLILDEVSRFNELILTSAKPTLLTTAGQIWMCSTPCGKQGYFWEAFQNKNNRFKIFHLSSEKVIGNRTINGSWTEKIATEAIKFLADEKKEMSELQYGQEYLGLFLEDLRRFFEDKLIDQICILKRPEQAPKENNYIGCDLARMGDDEIAYCILNSSDTVVRQIENIAEKKKLTTETEARIISLSNIYNAHKIGIDAGAGTLGVSIYDHLLNNPETRRKVIAINNRAIALDKEGKKKQRLLKEDLYDNLRSMMEKREILLLNDDNLKASFRSVQIELTEGAVTKVRIFGDYTHIVESIIRAAWLAKKEKKKEFFITYC